MIITATGYTTGEIKVEEGEYGRNATVCIRAKTINGKQTNFINATFYGKKIDVLQKYVNEDGRQVTITGGVKQIAEKTKKDGNKYIVTYMEGYQFSIPENSGPGEERYSSSKGKKASVDEDVAF
jgi:single-stranded DNA-binding protein